MQRTVKLSNGIEMPNIGFGTYPLTGEKLHTALLAAFDNGCRLIDTAHCYPNEDSIGNALKCIFKDTFYKREDLFITSKIGDEIDNGMPVGYYFYNSNSCPDKNTWEVVNEQLNDSLVKLKTDYIDLLLIHWPYNDFLEEIWQVFEELYKAGKVRAIGVSNCRERHLERISKAATIQPMVNQLYVSPLNTQKKMLDYCHAHDIVLEAYSPLMFIRQHNSITASVEFASLCKSLHKSAAQVALRWNLQRGVIPIPKSGTPERIKENYDLYDFELTKEQMDFINSFNEDYQYLPESRYCPGY